MRRRRPDGGQAAVELAMALPVVVVLLLAVVQAGLVVRDQLLVVHAAREGAREAAVDAAAGAARDAALARSGLDARRVSVNADRGSGRVEVTVAYRSPTDVPLIGGAIPDVTLAGRAVMRVEE